MKKLGTKKGSELVAGDIIPAWWSSATGDVIMSFRPYVGTLALAEGTRIAMFARCKGGMRIDANEEFDVVSP